MTIGKKFLVMGLPGSGKTTLAKILSKELKAVWLNADEIRKKIMIGIFRTREEADKQRECIISRRNIMNKAKM